MKINMSLLHWLKFKDQSKNNQKEIKKFLGKLKKLHAANRPRACFTVSLASDPDKKDLQITALIEGQSRGIFSQQLDKKHNFANVMVKDGARLDAFYKNPNINYPKKQRTNNLINEIICVEPRYGSEFLIVVNGDYKNTITGDKNKSWDLLLKLAKEGKIYFGDAPKWQVDYFNSNKNNRLYTQTGCMVTKILKKEGEYFVPNIEMSVISERAYSRRKSKSQDA